ncbi:MAG: SDR family oxidoreductase [Synergistaceae bacterium]|nr:SDR family oxidoreductase [Synergistaceae bacterium]
MFTLIVGACSGIGENLLMKGRKRDYILTENDEKYDELVNFVTENEFSNTFIYKINVNNNEEIKTAFKEMREKRLVISELAYLAGINFLSDAFDTSEELWDLIMGVNLKGAFFVMKEACANMVANEIGGRIVCIASQHGVVANVDRAAYCASKAGLINLCKALALEWACYGIKVNCVSPTFILSKSNQDILLNTSKRKEYLNNIPLKRYCDHADIVRAVNFLLSGENEMITGHNLVVDGGWTAK